MGDGKGHSEEWSWSDSDGEGGDPLDGVALATARQENPGRSATRPPPGGGILDSSENGLERGGESERSRMGDPKKDVKTGVRQMVALGLCSPQAAEMFLRIESDSGSRLLGESSPGASRDLLAASESRLAASERALKESEEQQLRLQAELMRHSLHPHADSSHRSGGVTPFDIARAQREAEKVMMLQRKVADGEERERQQATMQAKMEELLRLQEVALSEREESSGSLEEDLAVREAKLRLLTEQVSQMEQTHSLEQEAAVSEIAELKARNQVLEEGIVERDEQLRKCDGENLRLHEIQLEEKENQLRNLEARLAANGGDQIQTLTTTFSHTLDDRELRLAKLEHDLKQVKSTCREHGRKIFNI